MASKYSKETRYTNLGKIEVYLSSISPNVDFDEFYKIVTLVFVETHGSNAGREVLEAWARGRSDGPLGTRASRVLSATYDNDDESYAAIRMLKALAEQAKKRSK